MCRPSHCTLTFCPSTFVIEIQFNNLWAHSVYETLAVTYSVSHTDSNLNPLLVCKITWFFIILGLIPLIKLRLHIFFFSLQLNIHVYVSNKVCKEAKIRNRYNQVPHLTQDTTWESDKNTHKRAKRPALSQQVTTNTGGKPRNYHEIVLT